MRTVVINEEPWFVAKDVLGVLGLSVQNASTYVKKLPDEMRCQHLIKTPNRDVEVWCTNEPGLYRLIMRSDKPEAVAFQNWIAAEVLPSIRKQGMYMTPSVAQEAIEETEVFLARALLTAKEVIED